MLIVAAALVRLAIASAVPLVPDEAYYWEWSRRLAAGYFDHPPAIALLIRVGTAVFGDTPFGVRVGSNLAGFAATAAGVALAERIGGGGVAAWRAALMVVAMPLAGIGLLLATPDVPLLCASAVALWAVDHAITPVEITPERAGTHETQRDVAGGRRKRGGSVAWWVVAGMAIGVAMDAKYSAVLVAAGVALACAAHPALRRQWGTPGPYLAVLAAGLVALPVLAWNASHDWISVQFQLHHGLGGGAAGGSTLARELNLFGAQAALVSPILFALQVWAVARALALGSSPRAFLLATVAAAIIVFFAWSARTRVSPNWLAPAVLPSAVLLAITPARPAVLRWERLGVVLGALMTVGIYLQVLHPVLPLRATADPTAQAFGWDELARAIEARPATWVAADRYQDAAELAWHLHGHPPVFSLNIGGRRNQYDLWPTLRDRIHLGDSITLVLDERDPPPPDIDALSPHFAEVTKGELVEMHRGSAVVARRRLWHLTRLTSSL
jgi:4-amino-4-deoxy-L-arabinose transferase-like glycosyltransferase